MFNFNLMNRALKDSNLSDSAFRMLYIILNNCSLNNSNSTEIHNGYFMKVLNKKERMITYLTNELVEKGYITKKINGTSKNKLANTYTLVEVNDTPTDSLCDEDANNCPLTDKGAINDAKNCTLKNNNKINNKNNIFLSNTIGIYTGTNINTGYNKNKFIKHDVNNINTGNSDVEIKDLRIEEKINLNNENEMNEERMNEMNNINNSNETYINTSTKSLEDILTEQSDEFNNIIQFMNNSVENTDVVNTSDNYKNISVVDTDEVNTSNKSKNISVEEQKRYQRLFNKCKSQIENWSKTHDYSCVSMFDAYFTAINDMNDENLLSVKQWDAAQRYLFQRFQNLRNGYFNYIQKKNKTISSNEVNESNSPDPHGSKNDQIEEVV